MREHCRKRRDRARGAAVRELPIHLVGDRSLLQHDDDVAGLFGERRNVQIDLAIDADPRRAEVDLVFVDRVALHPDLLDQRQQRTAERDQLLQRLALQQLIGNLEEGFGGDVGIDDAAVGRHQQHRIRQSVQNGLARRRTIEMFGQHVHAAALHEKSSNASRSSRLTSFGCSIVRTRCRHAFSVSTGARLARAATSSAQPRCLRAWRRPTRTP